MNIVTSAGAGQGYASEGGNFRETMGAGAFVMLGLILLIAAIRLLGRHDRPRHFVRDTAHRGRAAH